MLDTGEGIGTAKGMKLRFKSVPILYLPSMSFPISDARKSGILTPEIGSAGRSGNEMRVPIYWNIAPNYDATITPTSADQSWLASRNTVSLPDRAQ